VWNSHIGDFVSSGHFDLGIDPTPMILALGTKGLTNVDKLMAFVCKM